MESMSIKLMNAEGLHARPAAIFVQIASKFSSEIGLEAHGTKVDGKSIIGIMSLGAFHGEEIIISAKGTDSKEAIEALRVLIDDEFKVL